MKSAAGTAVARQLEDDPGWVRVCVPNPRDLQLGLQLDVKGEAYEAIVGKNLD